MIENSIVLEGKDLNLLIQMGLEKLNKREDQVEIDVLEKGRTIAGVSIKKHKIKITINDDNLKQVEQEKKISSNIGDKLEALNNKSIGLVEHSIHERFELIYKEDGVYLSVNPKEDITVNLQDVFKKIKKKKIQNVDYNKIEEIVNSEKKACIKIAPEQEELLIDSTVDIEISKDKMSGYMVVHPADGGREYTTEDILESIKEEIKYGLDENIVREYVNQKKYGTSELIASGLEVIDGKDGYIEYKIRQEKESTPHILEDGSVDFRKLDLIKNVTKGEVLAELYHPEEGRDGINVLGEVLEYKPGVDKNFNYGVNIKLSEDETKLVSDLDGQTCIENGKVIVYELYTVPKDVDNSTGDIEFNGNIKINGNVLTGFTVVAKGNIEIDGVVEGSTIKCGGDLFIKRGIQGYNVANIHSNGNIITKYIENATINASGNIESEAIMHSDTVCGGAIMIGGKKGLLVGGMCKAEGKINAKVIGSHMATATLLEVGLDPVVRENQKNLKTMKKSIETDIDKFCKMINHIHKIKVEGELSPEKQEILDKSMVAKVQLEKKKTSLDTEIEIIDEKINNASKGTINVKESIYSGVKITIGNSTILLQEKKDYCTIYRDEGEIKIGPFAE